MPHYYVMPLDASMPEAVAQDMANETEAALHDCKSWLPDTDLAVYASEYVRTGFQGGLNWYRVFTGSQPEALRLLDILAGKKIEVPCSFLSGSQDWGSYQEPGAVERMVAGEVCADFRGLTLIKGAGHWAPQEKPEEVASGILQLIRSTRD
jgi:microsomal epoxide hydrolase